MSRNGESWDGRWIGHYGCANRLVKVATEKPTGPSRFRYRLPKIKFRVDCPACGFTHLIYVQWRRPRDLAELDLAEVTV